MFVKTDPQRSLLECEFLLPPQKAERLRKSWAEPFRTRILPLIDEELFRDAFSETTGRPNTSIRMMVALHLLKETNDLTDEQVLEELEYNLQWHYALDLEPEETHTCQKSLHNFRERLMANERAQQLFVKVTKALAEADGLSLGRQRLDSTHVVPNIAVLTRLGLFVETVTHFLKELRAEAPEAFASLDKGYVRRYLEREGYFSDAKREQARRRLPVVATDIYALVRAFESDVTVSAMPSYQQLERLFDEQCELVTDDDDESGGEGGPVGGGGLRVKAREPKEVRSDSLQSPHDPDATYGHKGKGYEVQITETCGKENRYQVVTATMVNGAHESDQKAVEPMLDRLEQGEMKPKVLEADTGYGSGENIVASAKRGVDLHAPVQNPKAPPPKDHFAAPVTDEYVPARPQQEPERSTPAAPESPEPEKALGLETFVFDATYHELRACPAGKAPSSQHVVDGQLIATFAAESCGSCPLRSRCPTRLFSNGERQLRRGPASIATEVRQAVQQTAAFKDLYRERSGIESTNQEGKGRHGLGDLRIRGKPKVELAATMKLLALNVKRAVQHHVLQMAECAA